jgi:hypothetical protein
MNVKILMEYDCVALKYQKNTYYCNVLSTNEIVQNTIEKMLIYNEIH